MRLRGDQACTRRKEQRNGIYHGLHCDEGCIDIYGNPHRNASFELTHITEIRVLEYRQCCISLSIARILDFVSFMHFLGRGLDD
jgi:hypothetical protein